MRYREWRIGSRIEWSEHIILVPFGSRKLITMFNQRFVIIWLRFKLILRPVSSFQNLVKKLNIDPSCRKFLNEINPRRFLDFWKWFSSKFRNAYITIILFKSSNRIDLCDCAKSFTREKKIICKFSIQSTIFPEMFIKELKTRYSVFPIMINKLIRYDWTTSL